MNTIKALKETSFKFKTLKNFYRGKVRDVYELENDILVIVVTDRISAFDIVFNEPIPYKGQVLNLITEYFLDTVSDIVPIWKRACPHPNVMIGIKCNPYPIEFIVRGYICGSLWRNYIKGLREINGYKLPNNLKENQKLPEPIITPTTKAIEGHDQDITFSQILENKILPKEKLDEIINISLALFKKGSIVAENKNLILVDTKYEFGLFSDTIYLIDEVHTPDSSRYFIKDQYENNFNNGLPVPHLSKEFLREWLISKNFTGEKNQPIPTLPYELIIDVSNKYISLYEKLTSKTFIKQDYNNIEEKIYNSIINYLSEHFYTIN